MLHSQCRVVVFFFLSLSIRPGKMSLGLYRRSWQPNNTAAKVEGILLNLVVNMASTSISGSVAFAPKERARGVGKKKWEMFHITDAPLLLANYGYNPHI